MAVLRKTLSNRTVAALKVECDTMFWDRDLIGFGVRFYPSGGKVYVAQAREQTRKGRPARLAECRRGPPEGGAHHLAHQGGRGAAAPATRRQGERRPDGGRPGGALPGGACEGLAEAENPGERPWRAPQPHPAGSRQGSGGSGRATPCRRSSAVAERVSRRSEPDGQDPVAHVPAERGLGACPGRQKSLPVGREIPRSFPRTLSDRCRVRPAGAGAGRGRRRRQFPS